MPPAIRPSELPMPPPPPWRAEIGYRMRHYLVLKIAGVSAATWLFFIGYFELLRHPVHPVTVMPLTALDHWIPFQPQALLAYVSLWLYIGFAPGLQRTLLELVVYGLWAATLCLIGLGVFYRWPTEVPPLTLAMTSFPGFALLQGVDAAGNACPSMHVAIAMFSAIRLEQLLRQVRTPMALRLLNLGWLLAISYSTLAIKQHVLLDVLAGAALGAAVAWPSMHWRPGGRGWPAGAAVRAAIISRHR